MKTGILFDMDGTLWDSSEEVAYSWSQVLLQYDPSAKPFTVEDIRAVMGLTMTEIAKKLFAKWDKEKQLVLLHACTERENAYLAEHGARLYAGVEETLKILGKTFPLFIVSNCQSGYIEAFLSYYHFEKYFADYGCFGDNGYPKAENISLLASRAGLTDFYYVGDTMGDYEAAKRAGGKFIHASYGFGEVAFVPSIAQFYELPEVLGLL